MKTIIIEDEAPAARLLRDLLGARYPDVSIAAEADRVASGLRAVIAHDPDLVFLDVNLPDGTGFDLIKRLPDHRRPEIIFVTSEDQHAYQAIQVAALHYLVKPVSPDELNKAMKLARLRLRQKNSEERLSALLANLEADAGPAGQRIGIATDQGVEFVTADEIVFCEGVTGYTRIHLRGRPNILSSYRIGEYRSLLEPFGIYAVHKSYLVNMNFVRGIVGGKDLQLTDGRLVPISRRRKDAVLQRLTGRGK